jgi:dCTP deaminase
MIVPDHMLHQLCQDEDLVKPYEPTYVQPASIDVRLADHFRVFEPHDEGYIDLAEPVDITKFVQRDRFVLHPGEFVLGVTEEVVQMPLDLVARIEGKSSLGRLGLIVHATAGFIDPGFTGRITLEMTNLLRMPIVLRPGKLIAQLSFHMVAGGGAEVPYQGRYQGDMTAEASRYGK